MRAAVRAERSVSAVVVGVCAIILAAGAAAFVSGRVAVESGNHVIIR